MVNSLRIVASRAAAGVLVLMTLVGCAFLPDDSIEVPDDARLHVIESGRVLYEADHWTQGQTSTQTVILVITPEARAGTSSIENLAEGLRKRGWRLRNPDATENVILTLKEPEAIVHLNTVQQYLSYPSRRDKINAEIREQFLQRDGLVVAEIEPPAVVG